MMRRLIAPLASLRLTVALLAAAMLLIFTGTLAQVHLGVWQTVETYFRSFIAWVDVRIFLGWAIERPPAYIPIPGGWLVGGLMIVNLLAAHAMRFRMERRRIGIIGLHAGVIVLLVGEIATGLLADEGMMSIDEGGSASHVEDLRSVELAVVDQSSPAEDRVYAFRGAALADGRTLAHADLPFDIEIVKWMANARLLRATEPTPIDRGIGREAMAEELRQVSGVEGSQVDAPAAHVRLRGRDGALLGTWLVSADLLDHQAVPVDGRLYGISLRHRRTYKPYTLHLIDFRHDKFVGTEVARNFSSQVRLVDQSRRVDREAVIWMNNPLRHAGETFYQASYKADGTGTVLQVVRNPAAPLPYVACALVGGGMMLHFALALWTFLRRRAVAATEEATLAGEAAGSCAWWPWAVGAAGILFAFSAVLRPMPRGEYDVATFASLPVSAGGRVKPMDTAARHVLRVAGGRQSIRTESGTMGAVSYILDLMARPEEIADLPVVRVDHPDVLALLGLPPEAVGRISLNSIEPRWDVVAGQAMEAMEVSPRQRDLYQRSIVNLFERVQALLAHSQMQAPYTIPPMGPEEEWRPFHEAFLESGGLEAEDVTQLHPAVAYYVAMMTAYRSRDAASFNRTAQGYAALLERDMPEVMHRARLEVLYNRATLFAGAMALYIPAFVLACGGLLLMLRTDHHSPAGRWLRTAAVALLWAGFIVHTVAIAGRIYLQGRPPVTNLYSSAVFVGWAAVLFALVVERLHRMGLAAMGAATVGFVTLVIAHNLGSDGDTMQMMQAVLDSNFWLATHVVTITLGYSANFLAGTLAGFFLMLGVFSRAITRERTQAMARMVYGIICFALLLSFVGTVLGGIWADQSWGRFWGWDPKENGAALVVLINAIILHARWGGMIRERGLMVLAVSGNIVTAWSWFGTNMLGVGLHSYGFMDSAAMWLVAFMASQFAVMALGLLPDSLWRSRFALASARPTMPTGEGRIATG